jgi:predicted alpha/beta hydrolase family esterase
MSTFVLIPGAGGDPWYWHRIVALLQRAGHQAVAVDLPAADDAAALPEYARQVIDAIGQTGDVVLVAQSLGAFTAPLVAATVAVQTLVFVNAMIPLPGETPGAWWANTGSVQAREAAAAQGGYGTELDPAIYFLHDVPPEVLATGEAQQRPEAATVFGSVCDFDAWPSVPVRVVAGADDRFFPVSFQRKVAHDRLGLEVDVLAGGHLIALSQPIALANYLLGV